MRLKILDALEEVRPMLQRDGGDIEFVDYFNYVVTVRLQGACHGCPHSGNTMKFGVERILRERYPEIVAVENASSM